MQTTRPSELAGGLLLNPHMIEVSRYLPYRSPQVPPLRSQIRRERWHSRCIALAIGGALACLCAVAWHYRHELLTALEVLCYLLRK
jgi:hypothetical protein